MTCWSVKLEDARACGDTLQFEVVCLSLKGDRVEYIVYLVLGYSDIRFSDANAGMAKYLI